MAYWTFYNPHPQQKIVCDCVKRAITKASGKDYKQVALELNRYKKHTGAKSFNDWVNVTAYMINELNAKRLSFPAVKGEPRMNGKRFCEEYPKGTYILQMAGHVCCCVDGMIYDTWDCTEKCVYTAHKIK